jgi:hypothetical protein
MELKQNVGNEKSWVYFCPADYADAVPKQENLCFRFANIESMFNFFSLLMMKVLHPRYQQI